jgi:beta-glucanase (GH16 family)
MFYFIFSLLFIVVFKDICPVAAWNPSNFSFNPGDDYELVFQDEFENVGPVKAIINGKAAYAPNPKNWGYITDFHEEGTLQNFTDSIYNSYVQDNQLTIVALKEGYTSAMLTSEYLQEFTFGIWAAKIRLPYGQGMWPSWWLVGNADKYGLDWPTSGENDIVEMVGGSTQENHTDQYAHGTVHWNNQSNTMNPVYNKMIHNLLKTPDGSKLHDNSLVYWSEWTPTNISIGLNEFIYNQVNTTDLPESINPVWAFSGKWPFYMILSLQIGGDWPGPPDNTTVWPQQMVFDWVRVYQKKKTIISK